MFLSPAAPFSDYYASAERVGDTIGDYDRKDIPWWEIHNWWYVGRSQKIFATGRRWYNELDERFKEEYDLIRRMANV